MTFAYSHHGPRYNAARFFIYGLSPDACSGAAHSACQPPSRQGEASQSANDALHAASIDGPPGTPSDEDKRKPSTIVQTEWRIADGGWRMADEATDHSGISPAKRGPASDFSRRSPPA